MLRRVSSRLCQFRRFTEDGATDGHHIIPMGKSDQAMQSTVSFLSKDMNDSNMIGIRGISSAGFRLYDNSFLYGPIAVFPKTVLSWRVLSPDEITPASLELFFLLQPKIDILVLGVGDRKDLDSVRQRVMPFISKHKVGLEIMPTEDAIATFNFLNAEYRYVAAALFPPRDLVVTDSEYSRALNYIKPYDELDEHPLLGPLEANIVKPAADLIKRIWGEPRLDVLEKVEQIAEERIESRTSALKSGIRHDSPRLQGSKEAEDQKKIPSKGDRPKLDDK
uniref:NADH dehydrogenase [ubiquinone] 1 alpha subcomplex assembly factor 3 n=1 Tax=Panagrellus redivivus TaxID=6233 RepID=A0A7E4WAH3_PANRE